VIGTAAMALWSTRRVSRQVLTPDDVGEVLDAAGWSAVDAYRWRDPIDRAVLGWPLAMAAVERRARTMDALAVAMVAVDGGGR
jgi:hypothetical protein